MIIIKKFIPFIQLTPYSKTILTKKDLLTINKRFLPSEKIVTIAQKIVPQQQNNGVISASRKLLIPHMNSRTPLGLYQPRSTTVLCRPLLYDHRSSLNNLRISNPNIKFNSLLENKKIDILFEEARIAVNVQKYLEILDDIKVKNFIKSKFSEKDLINILTDLQKIEVSSERKQEILYTLQIYFKSNPPTIEDAALFLEMWQKNNCVFTALDFKPKSNEVVKSGKNQNSTDAGNNKNIKKSLEDKQKTIMSKMSTMCKKMKEDFLSFEHDPKKKPLCNIIQDWSNYLINRSNALPIQPEEFEINNKLKLFWEISGPKQEDVLAKIKDNLKILKEKSTLTEELTQDPLEKCFITEDYNFEISRIKNILNFLKNTTSLSTKNIKLLTINSSAATIDAEGTFKLTQEAYKNFSENKDILGFNYMDVMPKMDYILTQIKDKKYVIVDEYKNKPGSLIDIAYLGHKTLVIHDESSGKKIKIRMGFLTSTNDESTFLLDEYQQTNPDLDKQNKKQYFRILSNFIVVDEKEPLLVDMETTLLLQSKNSNDKDITEILQTNYENQQNIWSKNNYQLSYNANEEFLHNIAIIFYEKKLQMLKDDLKNLEEGLKNLSFKDLEEKNAKLIKEKIKYMEDKKLQQYISLLPVEYQELYKALTFFNKKQQKDNIRKEKQEFKQKIENAMATKKVENETKIKTAKEKKDDYVKNKQKLPYE